MMEVLWSELVDSYLLGLLVLAHFLPVCSSDAYHSPEKE